MEPVPYYVFVVCNINTVSAELIEWPPVFQDSVKPLPCRTSNQQGKMEMAVADSKHGM